MLFLLTGVTQPFGDTVNVEATACTKLESVHFFTPITIFFFSLELFSPLNIFSTKHSVYGIFLLLFITSNGLGV
jgi:hypothetical protein